MRKVTMAGGMLMLALTAPAFGQEKATQTSAPAPVRVITNADLGQPVKTPHVLTAAEWQSLVAHQFVYIPPARPDYGGARVTVLADSTPQPYIPPTYPLSAPFFMSTYTGPYFHGHGPMGGRPGSGAPAPSTHVSDGVARAEHDQIRGR